MQNRNKIFLMFDSATFFVVIVLIIITIIFFFRFTIFLFHIKTKFKKASQECPWN